MRKLEYIQILKNNYMKITNYNFNKVVSIEEISKEINVAGTIENFLNEKLDNRFKIELLMFPSWAGKSKVYKIFDDHFTHIKIKKDF